ncbi:hypothetical protein O7626_13955 [Micromonospora sp. WMMD1102]|uniref:hypothetical protein n=1 Tax=Micromonospora sp. WMMD1102 TaxID=3016105 RepID=UPI00241520C6|nr:hypothetical protein [Micromonospora sp. WMMD1102]MDG4787021.1 hypothetical protein [Micromonospora sp. WMMD1102]
MKERTHNAQSDVAGPDAVDAGHPVGDIEVKPARSVGLRRAVLAGLAVGAGAYAISLDLATYSVAHTTCCG